MQLPPDIKARVDAMCLEAEAIEEGGDVRAALAKYQSAYALLPDPREDWDEAWWFFATIGDCYFQVRDFERADDQFRLAMVYGEPFGNAFIRMRRGQTLLELGQEEKALEELTAAYMLEGAELFGEEDPKYFEFIKQHLRPPADGKW